MERNRDRTRKHLRHVYVFVVGACNDGRLSINMFTKLERSEIFAYSPSAAIVLGSAAATYGYRTVGDFC
jgi:hypothetical protein